jgi:multidrug efflux pump subunit AcrA (membrane-fusion protein)
MPENNSPLEIRSNEMEEVVGNVPAWIIQWGITVLFIVAILGLFISNFIRYPDTLMGQVLIQATEQPGKVTVRREDASQEFKFLVKEGDQVVPGDTLLIHLDKNTGKSTPTITPMAGKIYISKGIDEKNTLDQLIWVVPKSSKAEIKIKYDNKRAGNVRVGQSVKIELTDFPSSEYGYLEGRVSSILPIQMDGKHQAYVELKSKKIITSENKEIPISPVMEGSGEILLNDRSIFQRIFGSIFH